MGQCVFLNCDDLLSVIFSSQALFIVLYFLSICWYKIFIIGNQDLSNSAIRVITWVVAQSLRELGTKTIYKETYRWVMVVSMEMRKGQD